MLGIGFFYLTFRPLFRISEAILKAFSSIGSGEQDTDYAIRYNFLLLPGFHLNHNFLRVARPMSDPPG